MESPGYGVQSTFLASPWLMIKVRALLDLYEIGKFPFLLDGEALRVHHMLEICCK